MNLALKESSLKKLIMGYLKKKKIKETCVNENSDDKNFVDKDFWSCTLSLLCGRGAPEGVVEFLPYFSLVLLLNLK